MHAWVLARIDRHRAWKLFREALTADLDDTQGGTTREGIHLGAMAGTVDLLQRCYSGVETRADALWLHPLLPDELPSLTFRMRYRNQPIVVSINHDEVELKLSEGSAEPIDANVEGTRKTMAPGETWTVKLAHSARVHQRQPAEV